MKRLALLLALSACTTAPKNSIDLDGITHNPPTQTTVSDRAPIRVPGGWDLAKQFPKKVKAAFGIQSTCAVPTVTSIAAYNGQVFNFATPTRCVKSIMGEPICVAPFVLTSITPGYSNGRNGYMFNIQNHPGQQRFDDRAGGWPPFQAPQPLPITFSNVGDALVSVISHDPAGKTYYDGQGMATYVASAAVLTADSEARVCNAPQYGTVTTLMRRPPWGDKTLAYDVLDFLPNILPVPTFVRAPGLEQDLTRYYSGSVGMQAWEDWGVRMFLPADKKMDYGNYRADRQGDRMLAVLQDIPFEHRLPILLGLAQDSIDTGAAFLGGAVWPSNGGHNHGPHYALIKYLGWLTGDDRFKFKGAIGTPRVGEQHHFSWGSNFYVPSHTVIYKGFDGPSPATKPVSQYTEADKRQISYMLCCGTLHTQSGYIALNILGQMNPAESETDRIIMQWVKQFRAPYSQEWNNALASIGASTMPGWWGNAQAMANFFWPYFGW